MRAIWKSYALKILNATVRSYNLKKLNAYASAGNVLPTFHSLLSRCSLYYNSRNELKSSGIQKQFCEYFGWFQAYLP